MDTSILIAKLMGLPVLVAGIGILVNTAGYRGMAKDFLKSEALIYLSGVLILVTGLAIVIAHNRWAWDWTLIITIFGWMAILGGIFRMTYPAWVAKVGSKFIDRPGVMRAGGVIWIAVGAVLSYFGFGA